MISEIPEELAEPLPEKPPLPPTADPDYPMSD